MLDGACGEKYGIIEQQIWFLYNISDKIHIEWNFCMKQKFLTQKKYEKP